MQAELERTPGAGRGGAALSRGASQLPSRTGRRGPAGRASRGTGDLRKGPVRRPEKIQGREPPVPELVPGEVGTAPSPARASPGPASPESPSQAGPGAPPHGRGCGFLPGKAEPGQASAASWGLGTGVSGQRPADGTAQAAELARTGEHPLPSFPGRSNAQRSWLCAQATRRAGQGCCSQEEESGGGAWPQPCSVRGGHLGQG